MAVISPQDFVWIGLLESMAVESIEKQDWTYMVLTNRERRLIAMTVAWTYGTLKEMSATEEPALT